MRTEANSIFGNLTQDAIARAVSVATARGETIAVERLGELGKRLRSSSFHVAILGEFKRGKSTLVNALIGHELLPTGVLPLTSVVTRVRWGTEPGAWIAFESGERLKVSLDRLADFVTESANPANRAGVAEVDVRVPSDLLRTGVVVMDTPGVGSTLAHNTEETMRLLPDVDAAIFVTATDPPISDSEIGFLHAVRDHAHKMFFVLNKADAVQPQELDDVIRFTRGAIADALGYPVDVSALSARRSLAAGDAGLETFKALLYEFLARDMARTGVDSIATKTREVVARLHAGVVLELEAMRLSSEELAARHDQIEAVRSDVDRAGVGIKALLHSDVAALVASIEGELAEWRTCETRSLRAAARDALGEPTSLAPADLDGFVKMRLRADIDAWRPSIEARVAAAWHDLFALSIAEVDGVAARAVDVSSQVLAMPLPPAPAMDEVIAHSRFSFSFFEVPTLAESLLPDLTAALPTRSGGKLALRRVDPKIPLMVDRHSGRVRHDWVSRLNEAKDHLERSIDGHLDGLTQGLAAALDRARVNLESATASQGKATPALVRLADELARLSLQLEGEAR